MRVCIIHQYYKTPKTGGAIRSYYIAKHLKQLGHDVTVITARNNRAYSIDNSDGYDVHYLPVYYSNHLSFLSRLHAFFLYVWATNKLIKKMPPFEINYVITTPLSTGFIALKAKKRWGTPFIFEVGDLWPEAPIQLGIIKNPLLKRIAYHFEQKFYKSAKSIVALSPDIKKHIKLRLPNKPIDVITNFSDTAFFNHTEKSKDLEVKYNVENKFVISYLGTVGIANHLEYLLEAAKTIGDKVQFIIAGGGAKYESIKNIAVEQRIENITFFQHMDKEGVKEIMNITDAAFISFKNAPVLSTGSPNKFFDGLAAGKLIIVNFEGWIKNLIEKNQCGFYYNPDDPKSFYNKIIPFIEDRNNLKTAQSNARLVAQEYTPENQLANLENLLD